MARQRKSVTEATELYDEWLVAKKIGVRPRFVVRWRRDCGVEGVDYAVDHGVNDSGEKWERIGLTEEGVKKVARHLNFRPPMTAGCGLVKEGVQVRVMRMPTNPRILICERVAAREKGLLENVYVRDSGVFRVGDEILAGWVGGVLSKKSGGYFLPGEW